MITDRTIDKLVVWGSRGGVPASGDQFSFFGHATCCIQVETSKNNLIIDAGSGIVNLGKLIIENNDNRPIDIFISHYHFDHIIGLPFFAPLFNEKYQVSIHLPLLGKKSGIFAIDKLISPPLFPMNRSIFSKNVKFKEFNVGNQINISNDIICNSSLLNHPGSSTAFRIKGNQFDIVYASDVEANEKAEIESIINFSKGSNYIFIDSSYTDKELSKRRGWGHLSFKQVLEVSKKIKPTEVLIFHHDFLRTDKELKLILNEIFKKSENIQVCKENSIFYFK